MTNFERQLAELMYNTTLRNAEIGRRAAIAEFQARITEIRVRTSTVQAAATTSTERRRGS